MPVSASGRNGAPVGSAIASVMSATVMRDLYDEAHDLDRLQQHPAQVGGVEMVVAMLDRAVQLDAAAAQLERGEVQEVFVDHPLHEGLRREQHGDGDDEIAPGPLTDVDPAAEGEQRTPPAPRGASSAP